MLNRVQVAFGTLAQLPAIRKPWRDPQPARLLASRSLSWERSRTLRQPLHAVGHLCVQPYQAVTATHDDFPCRNFLSALQELPRLFNRPRQSIGRDTASPANADGDSMTYAK